MLFNSKLLDENSELKYKIFEMTELQNEHKKKYQKLISDNNSLSIFNDKLNEENKNLSEHIIYLNNKIEIDKKIQEEKENNISSIVQKSENINKLS